MKIEKILDVLLYGLFIGLFVMGLNVLNLSMQYEDEKSVDCASKKLHLVDSSSGYYCVKGKKHETI